jgi:hypothetical protein
VSWQALCIIVPLCLALLLVAVGAVYLALVLIDVIELRWTLYHAGRPDGE